jgi:hypothetical protein
MSVIVGIKNLLAQLITNFFAVLVFFAAVTTSPDKSMKVLSPLPTRGLPLVIAGASFQKNNIVDT